MKVAAMRVLVMLFVLTSISGMIGCGEQAKKAEQTIRYSNGQIKEKRIRINSDSADFLCESYYPSGSIESKYSIKNGLNNGYFKMFHPNGKLDFEGPFIAGRKIDTFKYYDSIGSVQKVIKFINYRDSSVSKPNEKIVFDTQGDTIFDKSYFYNFYSTGDTIKSNSELYHFKIVSRGSMFKYSYVVLCDFDEKFNEVDSASCDMSLMKKGEITLTPTRQKQGMNFIRGYILSTENPVSKEGILEGRAVEMYFSEKYYVVP